ncbi:MAG: hypothetical protein QOE58_524 [Actinomycetota bacterium]|nr:hypothetical protein [Actinomycetota bacterium]
MTAEQEIKPEVRQHFEPFYREHRRPAIAWALALGCSRDEAQDLVQEAFCGVLRRWRHSWPGDAQAKAYLIRAVEKQGFQLLRSKGSRERLLARLALCHTELSFELDHRAIPALAVEALQKLSRQQRRIVFLHVLAGYSLTDAAKELGIAPGTARNHFKRARDFLQTELNDDFPAGTPGDIL